MRTKRKMTATIICILFAVIFAGYGFWMSGNGSGTGFFLIWFALAALLAGCAAVTYLDGWTRLPVWILWIIRGILLVFVVSFVMIEGCIISQMHAKADENLDYIIVLGAQVRADGPSKVLKHRLNTAIDYLAKNPETICIVSGGQGYNEPCTEAQAMAEYLEAAGIAENRLILEDQSKTTEQNIKYSKKYIEDGASVGIITNDFHMFRAMQITKGQGLKSAKAIAAGSNPLYLPNNMLREYLAEWKYLIRTIL